MRACVQSSSNFNPSTVKFSAAKIRVPGGPHDICKCLRLACKHKNKFSGFYSLVNLWKVVPVHKTCRRIVDWRWGSSFSELSIRWRWVVSFTPLPSSPRRNKLGKMRPRAGLGTAKEGKFKVSFPAGNETSKFCTAEPVFCPLHYTTLHYTTLHYTTLSPLHLSFCTGM
jgi:hypothetical protein